MNSSSLNNQKCQPCSGNTPKMRINDVLDNLDKINNWKLNDDNEMIFKKFSFKNYKMTLDFINKIGKISEEEGHHPLLTTEWGRVTVQWWTHKIRNLHQNDFIMSSKTDDIFNAS